MLEIVFAIEMNIDEPPCRKGIQASPVGDDLFNWSAIVLGPQDTAWEGGVWKLKMSFNEEYPEKPPSVRFRE